jgi:hypothetical protein
MVCNGSRLINRALVNDLTGVDFVDISLVATMEGGSDEEVAGEEDSQGDEYPLGADERNAIDLILALVARSSQQLLGLHRP